MSESIADRSALLANLDQSATRARAEAFANYRPPAEFGDSDAQFHYARCTAALDYAIAAANHAEDLYKQGDLAMGDYYMSFAHTFGDAFHAGCGDLLPGG